MEDTTAALHPYLAAHKTPGWQCTRHNMSPLCSRCLYDTLLLAYGSMIGTGNGSYFVVEHAKSRLAAWRGVQQALAITVASAVPGGEGGSWEPKIGIDWTRGWTLDRSFELLDMYAGLKIEDAHTGMVVYQFNITSAKDVDSSEEMVRKFKEHRDRHYVWVPNSPMASGGGAATPHTDSQDYRAQPPGGIP